MPDSRSLPNQDVIAARRYWFSYCRRAFSSFRARTYSDMSYITMYHFAVHMRNMFLLNKYTEALSAHASERGKLNYSSARHRFKTSQSAMAALRNYAASRRGSAAAQRFRHGRIISRANQMRASMHRPRSGRSASMRSFRSFHTAFTHADSMSTRRSTSSMRAVSPSICERRDDSNPSEISQERDAEMDQLKSQLAHVTAELDKLSSSANKVDSHISEGDQDFAQAVKDSLGEAALSPARPTTAGPTVTEEAQDQLSDQMAVMAAAKERAMMRHGNEKQLWDEAMLRRYNHAGTCEAPAQARDEVSQADLPESLLVAAQENSAYQAGNRKLHSEAQKKLASLAASSSALGPGLQHIINNTPKGSQSSDLQLLIREIASLKNEVLMMKNSRPPSNAFTLRSDFSNMEASIMQPVDREFPLLKHGNYLLTQDVLKSCLRPGCSAVQIPGSLTCVCGAPRNMLDFKCPDPVCAMRQVGTVSEMLTQYECRHCFLRLPWSETDPAARAKIRQAVKSSVATTFDTDPPAGLATVFWKKHKITQCEDASVMLIRGGNSADNYMVAPNATTVKVILEAIFEGAKAASRNNVLGIKIKSMHSAKIILGLAKLKVGKSSREPTPGWHIEITEVVSRAASHMDSTMEWSTQVLEAKPIELDDEAPNAILILHEMFKGMTEYICVFLGDSFAQEHHVVTEQLTSAHYSEADVLDGVHVHFSITQIITMYHDAMHRFGNIMEAYVNKSPLLHQHYEGDLLWSHIDTSAQRPKFFIRSLVEGAPAWNPHIQTVFFTSAQIAFRASIQAAVNSPSRAASNPNTTPTGSSDAVLHAERIKQLETQLAAKATVILADRDQQATTNPSGSPLEGDSDNSTESLVEVPSWQEFIAHNTHEADFDHPPKYPDATGVWRDVILKDWCPRCFRWLAQHKDPAHANNPNGCAFPLSPYAPIAREGRVVWNLEVVKRVAHLPPEKRVEAYKKAAKARVKRMKARKDNPDSKDPTHGGALTKAEQLEYSAFQTGDAIASKFIHQPAIADYRASITVSGRTQPRSQAKYLQFSEDNVNAIRQVCIGLPSLLDESIIEVHADAICVGMDIDTASGVQHHRCGFKAIAAQVEGLQASTLFAEALESSVKFLDGVGELEEKFEHLAAAEVVEVFLMRGISCHDSIFAKHQPTSMFWLRTAFPRCLNKRPVLITYMHEDLLRFQLYICAAGEDYTSDLSAQVIHVLCYEVHSYVLQWKCDWTTLDKVLLSLGKVHRFADVGINLCNTIERTLEAVLPTAPDYLKGAEMLTADLEAFLPEKGSGSCSLPASDDDSSSHETTSTSGSDHSDSSPRLGDREGLCQHYAGIGSHGCIVEVDSGQAICYDCQVATSNLAPCVCDCHECEDWNRLLAKALRGWTIAHGGPPSPGDMDPVMIRVMAEYADQCFEATEGEASPIDAESSSPIGSSPTADASQARSPQLVHLPHFQQSPVLDMVLSTNLTTILEVGFDPSPTTIDEENAPLDPVGNFNEVQAVRNIRAALTNEILVCKTLQVPRQPWTANIIDLLREVCIISKLRQPILAIAHKVSNLMQVDTSTRQSLNHLRWVMSATAHAWSRPLTTEFCCTLRPTLAYYSRLVEKVWGYAHSSPTPERLGLSFLFDMAKIDGENIERVWVMIAARTNSNHEQSELLRTLTSHALRLRVTLEPDQHTCSSPENAESMTPDRCDSESPTNFDMTTAGQEQILEQWNAYCSNIGMWSELVEVTHHSQESDADLVTTFISRMIQCTVIVPEQAIRTLDIIDSHHIRQGMDPPFRHNQFINSKLDAVFELVAASEDFVLTPSPRPYRKMENAIGSESSESASMSPIAAFRVNAADEPIVGYKQALLRDHQGLESHESWRRRQVERFYQEHKHHRYRLRRKPFKERPASHGSLSSMIDDSDSLSSSSYAHEVQGALGVTQVDIAKEPFANAESPPPSPREKVSDFHKALPPHMRLPDSADIRATSAGRTKQQVLNFTTVKRPDFRPRRVADRR